MSWVRPFSALVVGSAVLPLAMLAGCAEEPAKPARTPARASAAPPNAVMLDYMSPEELAHQKEMERQAAAPPPGAIGEKDPPPRIRQTIVIGKNNPDPVVESDHPQDAYDGPAPQGRNFADAPTYSRGGVYYYRGSGGYGGGAPAQGGGSPGTPRVGGDWPSAPSYGPKQMR